MTLHSLSIPLSSLVTVFFGAALLVVSTGLAVRTRTAVAGLGWVAVAGSAQAILALAAALRTPEGEALRAAAFQLLAVAAATALAALCSSKTGKTESEAGEPDGLATTGLVVAWLALLGLPPTIGFHSKIAICRALLAEDWTGWVALVLAASAACVWPALSALRSRRLPSLGRLRALCVLALIALTLLLGLYPEWGLLLAEHVARLAAPS